MNRYPNQNNNQYQNQCSYPNGIPPQIFATMTGNNYNHAYMKGTTIIDKHDTKYKGGLIHDNVSDILMAEHIVEYTIHVNSADRDYSTYSNPFNFTVIFGGIGQTIGKKFKPNGTFEQTVYAGQPKPKITRKFKNIKYIKLNHVIVPKTNIIEKISGTDDEYEYSFGDVDTELASNYKYLILKIKDLGNNKVLSTNDFITDDCYILYPDKVMGLNHYMWLPTATSRIFQNSNLISIDRLVFELMDDEGNLLFVLDSDGNRVNTKNLLNTFIESKEEGDPILKCVQKIHKVMQIDLELTFGIVENELATNVKYEI